MEAVFFRGLSPVYSNKNQRCGHSTLFSLYVDRFPLPTTYRTVSHNWHSWIRSPKLLYDDCFIKFLCMVKVWNLSPYKLMYVLGCLFVIESSAFLIENQLSRPFYSEDGCFYATRNVSIQVTQTIFVHSCWWIWEIIIFLSILRCKPHSKILFPIWSSLPFCTHCKKWCGRVFWQAEWR